MRVSKIYGQKHYMDQIQFRIVVLPDGCVGNDEIEAVAGILYTKLEQKFMKGYAQESATACADEARVVHVVHGATAEVLGFEVGAVVANLLDAVVDIDLLLNGVSMLNGGTPVQLDLNDAAYAIVAGTIDPAKKDLSDDDVLEISIDGTVGGGTLAKGVFAAVILAEDAA